MATWALKFVPAFLLLSFCSTAFSQDFPDITEIDSAYYQTEVQITDVKQETSAYATEYHNTIDKRGALKIYFQGQQQLVYYDNYTFQITEIDGPNCTAWDLDSSEYDYTPIYYGWLNKKPTIIGPSAPLWYAQSRKGEAKFVKTETVRSITCDKFELKVNNDYDDLTYEYYFASSGWTTPYQYKNLRIPVRIRIVGNSSRYALGNVKTEVDQVNDFAYFKPSIDDVNNLLPPVGLGCKMRQKTDYMPDVPKVFQYTAEVVDLLAAKEHEDIEIQFQRTWYDQTRQLARRDIYSRKKGFTSKLFDFKTGTIYRILDDGSCDMVILRDSDFQTYDYGMTSRIKTPKEVLNLDGEFYDMGKRTIRGLRCDTFESVQFNKHFKGKLYYKLVVTVYFTEDEVSVGIYGEMESRIPVYYIINGYETPDNKTLQLQYNIFGFDDVIWPEIYTSFRLDRCFTKPDSKAYFVLVFSTKNPAKLEEQDEMFIAELKTIIAQTAKVPELRIPYLKADYKPSGVFVTGLMLERPPALLQFQYIDKGPTVTRDDDLKVVPEAETLEECSYACVDESDFLCKGFYFCGKACFIKSTDPFDQGDGKTKNLGECSEYIRAEIESTNFRQSYLVDALAYLDESVADGNVSVPLRIKEGELILTVQDVIIGDGPYTGDDDTNGKPFTISDELRKLDSTVETVKTVDYVGSLNDCYKSCKRAGSMCSSFSYCPDSKNDNKECMITSELIVKGVTKDTDLIPDKNCNIYNLRYSDLFIPYPEKLSFLQGDKVIRGVPSLERCAASCRMEQNFTCRGFEYCHARKQCTLHKKHILELKPDETVSSAGKQCTHYAARYTVDYLDMGGVLVEDDSNVKYGATLEQCAQICSEYLKKDCKSFNYCPGDEISGTESKCALSMKLLRDDDSTTFEKEGCSHYEKRESVHDWDKTSDASGTNVKPVSGYTKKGFTGLVVGMIALGVIVGALGFIFYSYMRSRASGEGMAVRFMKNDS